MNLLLDSAASRKIWFSSAVAFALFFGIADGQESVPVHRKASIDPVLQTPEYAILKKLWSAYKGEIPRSEVNSLLSKGWGDEIFKLRVGLKSWLKLLPEPEWIEHRPKGTSRRGDQSELIAKVRLPVGDYQIAFVFVHDGNSGEIKYHDLWLAAIGGDLKQFWILQNDEVIRQIEAKFEEIRRVAEAIAGTTSDYDQLSKNLAKFRDLASRLSLLHKNETKEFLKHGDSLVSFGSSWDQTITKASTDTFKSSLSTEFVAKLRVQLTKAGGKLDGETKETVKQMLEQEMQTQYSASVKKLEEGRASNLDLLKKALSQSYEIFLKLLSD